MAVPILRRITHTMMISRLRKPIAKTTREQRRGSPLALARKLVVTAERAQPRKCLFCFAAQKCIYGSTRRPLLEKTRFSEEPLEPREELNVDRGVLCFS